MKKTNIFRRMINPNDATVSSKAFIGLCSFAILVINALTNLYWDRAYE
jgi:hypothetical protein